MKTDVRARDPMRRPVCPMVVLGGAPAVRTPSRFRRKKQFGGDTASLYNGNFKAMPKDT